MISLYYNNLFNTYIVTIINTVLAEGITMFVLLICY